MGRASYKVAKERVGTLSSVLHLTMKECQCHVYCDLMPMGALSRDYGIQWNLYNADTIGAI